MDSLALPKSFIRNVDMYLRKVCNHPYLGVEGDQYKLLYKYVALEAEKFEHIHRDAQDELYAKQLDLAQALKDKDSAFG